jgi:hypothetical protein
MIRAFLCLSDGVPALPGWVLIPGPQAGPAAAGTLPTRPGRGRARLGSATSEHGCSCTWAATCCGQHAPAARAAHGSGPLASRRTPPTGRSSGTLFTPSGQAGLLGGCDSAMSNALRGTPRLHWRIGVCRPIRVPVGQCPLRTDPRGPGRCPRLLLARRRPGVALHHQLSCASWVGRACRYPLGAATTCGLSPAGRC